MISVFVLLPFIFGFAGAIVDWIARRWISAAQRSPPLPPLPSYNRAIYGLPRVILRRGNAGHEVELSPIRVFQEFHRPVMDEFVASMCIPASMLGRPPAPGTGEEITCQALRELCAGAGSDPAEFTSEGGFRLKPFRN